MRSASGDAHSKIFKCWFFKQVIYSDGSDTNDPLRFLDMSIGAVAMSLNGGKLGIGVLDLQQPFK